MAKLWSTGPVHIFVGINGTSKGPVYLGTGEQAPDIDIPMEFTPVMNDIAGDRLPYDRLYEGSEASIAVTLTRWNENVVSSLMATPFITGIRGTHGPLEIGTLMGSEGYTFPTWLVFPKSPLNNGGLPYMTGMPAGYRFASCLNMSDRIQPGTKVNKHQIMLHAQRFWVGFNHILYDNNMAGVTSALLN